MKKIKFTLIVLINFIYLSSFSQNEFVVEINRANGTFLETGPAISGITWVYPNFRAFNENNGIFIFPSSDNPTRLYSIDVSNDSIIKNPVYNNLLVEFEYSNTSNILYGLLKDNANNVKYFASIDQSIGVSTTIGSSIPTANTYQGLSTFNQPSNQYIFLDPSNKLFSIDVTNGNIVSNPSLVLPVNYQLLSISFDDSTNTLYGLLSDNSINKHYLVYISTTTGIVTILGAGTTFGNSGSSAIDQINQQYIYLYYNGSYSIATIDISTGNVVYNSPLVTFASTDNFFSLKYDNIKGKLYSVHWDTPKTTMVSQPKISDNNSSIYPNPFNQNATIKFKNPQNENCTLTLFDNQGRLIQIVSNITTEKFEIERKNLFNGLYFYQLRSDKQVIASGKLKIE